MIVFLVFERIILTVTESHTICIHSVTYVVRAQKVVKEVLERTDGVSHRRSLITLFPTPSCNIYHCDIRLLRFEVKGVRRRCEDSSLGLDRIF